MPNERYVGPLLQNGSKSRKTKRNTKRKQPKRNQGNQQAVAPVATTQVVHLKGPRIHRSANNGDVVVEHREFLSDINGTVEFEARPFPINPGLYSSFPWLSQMANLYESYLFEKLEYEFETESSTTATGSVMAAVDYDSGDSAPVSKLQLAAYRQYARSAPWKGFKQTSLVKDLRKQKTFLTRNGALSANKDPQLYDTGNFFLATQGQADTSAIGELYVRYRVKLMTPQLGNPAIGQSLSGYASSTSNGATWTTTADVDSNAPLVYSGGAGGPTLTAVAPYSALIVGYSDTDALTGLAATGTATVKYSAMEGSADGDCVYAAVVNFLAGQTFTLAPTTGGVAQITLRIAQYNGVSLP